MRQSSVDGLRIRQFGIEDVEKWARTDLQRRHLVEALENSDDYLAAVLPDGRIVGKIGIRYDEHLGTGNLFQFDVVEDLRNLGIGTTHCLPTPSNAFATTAAPGPASQWKRPTTPAFGSIAVLAMK